MDPLENLYASLPEGCRHLATRQIDHRDDTSGATNVGDELSGLEFNFQHQNNLNMFKRHLQTDCNASASNRKVLLSVRIAASIR